MGSDLVKGMSLRQYKATWKREKDKQRRIERGLDQWKCRQCWAVITYRPRGGNRTLVCFDCAPDSRFRSMVRRYGVDQHMFAAMYFDQDGKCAIASCPREARAIDHDHQTGRVRGLVCQGCNVALGFLESPRWMADALAYLAEHSRRADQISQVSGPDVARPSAVIEQMHPGDHLGTVDQLTAN